MVRRNIRSILKLAIFVGVVFSFFTVISKLFLTEEESHPKVKLNREKDDIAITLPQIYQKTEETRYLFEKKDWHDYNLIREESSRIGPGEQGAALILTAKQERLKDKLYKVNGFNAFASDKIALNRSLKDIRNPGCKDKMYLVSLPDVSVIVPFHNEHWSTLLRTAYSVLNRSPKHLIREIILVDDASTKEHCKKPLDDYLAKNIPKVRVIRAGKRVGLIRARLLGAKAAVGSVLIFLDSHTEANTNWLPPLLEPIALNKRTAVCPFIDVIDYETFAYRAQDEGARGSFDWEFFYKRLPLLPSDLENPTEPFKSPVMAGGLFAISSEFFWELGGYDDGLEIWGGEQYELSFKIWQCGGQMVDAPCSRVGHIYRKFAPFPNPGIGDFVGRNYRRVAEVWMDEYKEYLYMRRPHYRKLNPGDISKQKELREKLKCKPFKWFMTEIAFDQSQKYPPVEPPDFATGEIKNIATNYCIDTQFRHENEEFGVDECNNERQSGEQQFVYTWHKDIRPKNRNICFDVSRSEPLVPVTLWNCHGMQGNQMWKYYYDTKQLKHIITGNCLDTEEGTKKLFMNKCDFQLKTQKWTFSFVNETALANW